MPEIDPMYDPARDYPELVFDDTLAVCPQATFDALLDYSHSNPTGVYPGKVWKRVRPEGGVCQLGSYEEHDPPDPRYLHTKFRDLVVVE